MAKSNDIYIRYYYMIYTYRGIERNGETLSGSVVWRQPSNTKPRWAAFVKVVARTILYG